MSNQTSLKIERIQTKPINRIGWIIGKEFASFLQPAISLAGIIFLAGIPSVIIGLSQGATYEQATMSMIHIFYILMIIAGLLVTMNTFIAERRQGTLELLYTLPITDFELVSGKIAFNFLALLILACVLDLFYLVWLAETPWYQALAALIGFAFVAYYSVSLGVFASSLADSPFISILTGFSVVIVIDVGGFYSGLFASPSRDILSYFHAFNQFLPFARGVVPVKGLVFFGSLGLLFHFLAIKTLEFRRFRGV
ncbi:MAG: hypothetical protein H3C43_09690 [Leptonema sp. (in: Bacteria)]|nr:hypothetical protein [Leptonema sp. (in: bacteria)]